MKRQEMMTGRLVDGERVNEIPRVLSLAFAPSPRPQVSPSYFILSSPAPLPRRCLLRRRLRGGRREVDGRGVALAAERGDFDDDLLLPLDVVGHVPALALATRGRGAVAARIAVRVVRHLLKRARRLRALLL